YSGNDVARERACGPLPDVTIRQGESYRPRTLSAQFGHPASLPHESVVEWSLRSEGTAPRRAVRTEREAPTPDVHEQSPAAALQRVPPHDLRPGMIPRRGTMLTILACLEMAFFLRRLRRIRSRLADVS